MFRKRIARHLEVPVLPTVEHSLASAASRTRQGATPQPSPGGGRVRRLPLSERVRPILGGPITLGRRILYAVDQDFHIIGGERHPDTNPPERAVMAGQAADCGLLQAKIYRDLCRTLEVGHAVNDGPYGRHCLANLPGIRWAGRLLGFLPA